MKIPTFKLMFQTSQKSDLATEMVVFNIRSKLREEGYEILRLSDKSISFKFLTFKFVWSHQAPYLLSGGLFKVTETNEGTVVILDYFINMLYPLLTFTFLIAVIIIEGEYWDILFFGVGMFASSVFQYFTTKNVGKKLIKSILLEE